MLTHRLEYEHELVVQVMLQIPEVLILKRTEKLFVLPMVLHYLIFD